MSADTTTGYSTEDASAMNFSIPPQRRKRRNPVLRALGSPLSGRLTFPLVCLAIWLVSLEVVRSIWPFAVDVLPDPSEVARFMWKEITLNSGAPYNLYETFAISLKRLAIGMLIALAAGTVIGLAMGLSKGVNAFFNDWVVAILAMPNLAWALFCGLAFGFGDIGVIVTVVLTGVPFVIINVREGVRNAPADLYDMSRAFGVSRFHTIRHVLIPSLMPFMFAAARYAFALGWKGLVVAEVFGGADDGAGWTIKWWYDAHQAHGVIGYALFFVIFALIFEKFMFDRLSRWFFRWQPQASSGEVTEESFNAHRATPQLAVASEVSNTDNAALESINQVTTGPRSSRKGADDTRRHHDG